MTTPDFSEPFDSAVDTGLGWLADNGEFVFDAVNQALAGIYKGVLWCIVSPPFYVVALVIALIGWRSVGLRFAILSALALSFCALIGLWTETASTLALVLTATFLGLLVAIPLGVLAGLAPSIDRLVDPCLDLVQTMPPYIYLLPAIALLGYGPATALLATFIVAVPPALRLTSLGIRMTPSEFIELGNASGVTGWQMFYKIRLPFALPSIMAGVNQSLMMAFGMVVIAGIVGSGGLGQSIYDSVRTLDIAKSINAAVAIVVLTMILDRLAQSAIRPTRGA
ncbi:ABC transporter permease [Pseudomonas syringae]|uniref:Protein ProW n=5 Tax=Pseudomonas syringae TaxID=317 RepID=A0A3M4KMV1_PSESF|nr:ABC transporter permease subunit [Pseudomonas syringae]EPM48656.1 protein ProW [Pseudomonas syringae pv. actinidiae ICMP 19098]EPN04334.1 protein ProW [Pseudomonas syringae pv. actinidiae ICMP 18804]EPN19354.1 protein ProW [Pseudomonas syringae pv. actinidiae ICMP 19100]EPN27266.1 protein ProW [Pseudomonas syringae pv. actinidiae ICMP 19099]EPN35202.1 protein ProW [Pseudomonas syringae pv. actinidiae ICMP 18883]